MKNTSDYNFQTFWDNVFDASKNKFDCTNRNVYDNLSSIDVPREIIELFKSKEIEKLEYNINRMFESWLYSTYAKTIVANAEFNDDEVFANFFKSCIFCIFYNYCEKNENYNEKERKLQQVRSFNDSLQLTYEKVLGNIHLLTIRDSINNYNEKLEQVEQSLNMQTDTLNKKVNEVTFKIKDMESDINTTFEKVKKKIKMQSQKAAESSITILGIFVCIVMVFFGGFSILENSITSMEKASSYRLYFTMIAFGGIMYNVVILLFFLISRITGKSISCKCGYFIPIESVDTPENLPCLCNNCATKKRNKRICKMKNNLPYIYWGNLVIISGLLFIANLKLCTYSNISIIEKSWFLRIIISMVAPVTILILGYALSSTNIGKKENKNITE